jgi:hypothetical protein
MLGFVWRVLAAGLALTVVQAAAAMLVDALLGPSGVVLRPGALGWVALSNLLTAAMLAWLAAWSRLTGMRLAGWLAVVLFGVATFNNLIEAVFFHVFGVAEFARYVLQGALTAAAFGPVLVFIMGRRASAGRTRVSAAAGPPGPWRLAAADLLYLACYLGAGTIIYPWVRDFYLGRDQPAQLLVVALQLFFRGPVFIALTLCIVRMIGGGRWERALVAGAALSVVGGVALLIPNPYLPDAVRWVHLIEVGVSNFVYGVAAAWLLTPPLRD